MDKRIQCPKCESTSFEFIDDVLEDDDKWLTIHYQCNHCDAEWYELFRRTETLLAEEEEDA